MSHTSILSSRPSDRPVFAVYKRISDVVIALVALGMLSPVLALVGLLILWDSGWPIVYRGVRAGRYGKTFRIYKFRTMSPGLEKNGGDTTSLNDPRVTRIGRLLRRYKIDELPQLANVVAGDMSIVGPRPELPTYTERYSGAEQAILSVRPGLTDFASIRYISLDEEVGEIDPDRVFEESILSEKNRLRLEYVLKQGAVTDLWILMATAYALLAKMTKNLVRASMR